MEAICSRSSTLVCGLPFPPSSSSSRHNTCCYAAAAMPSLNRRRPQLSCLTSRSSSGRRSKFVVTCGGVREIHEAEFSEVVLKSDRPVLVEFVAGWCGPCRLIAPAIESLQQEYEEKLLVVKIDHDSNPGLIEQYKVYGLPSLILFKDGKEVPQSRREGAITKAKLKEYIDTLLASVSVA